MKIKKGYLMLIVILLCIVIGIVGYLILKNTYFMYYKKSDLDTNVYKFNQSYVIEKSNLDKSVDIDGLKPITITKDGSNSLNELSLIEIEDLETLLKDISNYNKYIKENPNSRNCWKYNWYVNNDISYLIGGAGMENIDNKQLEELITYIKNPKVLKSAEALKVTNIVLEKFLSKLNNEVGNQDAIVTNYEYQILKGYLSKLKNIYSNMEHGSKCAKRIYIKNIKKCINLYRSEVGP